MRQYTYLSEKASMLKGHFVDNDLDELAVRLKLRDLGFFAGVFRPLVYGFGSMFSVLLCGGGCKHCSVVLTAIPRWVLVFRMG